MKKIAIGVLILFVLAGFGAFRTSTFRTGDNTLPTRFYIATYGTTSTINWDNSDKQKITLSGNTTFDFINGDNGQTCILFVIQDGTGSRTVTWDAACKFPGGVTPVLTTTASAVDIFTFICDGTYYYCVNYSADVK